MTYSDIYALRICQLCKNRKITINKLATLAGLKQSTIDNIIRGKSRNPQVRTLHKIANVFGMTLSEFLDFPELNDYSIDDEEDDESGFLTLSLPNNIYFGIQKTPYLKFSIRIFSMLFPLNYLIFLSSFFSITETGFPDTPQFLPVQTYSILK